MENTAQQATPPSQPVSPPTQVSFQPSSPSPSRKKFISIVVILLLVVTIPPSIYFLGQRQEVRQRASEIQVDPNVFASVYGKNILQSELDTFAQHLGVTDKKIALDTLIERKILDEESKKAGIAVSPQEITTELSTTNNENFQNITTFTKYEQLKEKILKANVKYIEGYVIDFWLPPFDYPAQLSADKKQLVANRRAQQQQVLDGISSKLQDGEEPVTVAKAIYEQYPDFQGSLGMNGKIITDTISDEELNESYVYVLSSDRKKTGLSDAMETMKEGDIKQVVPADGSGGKVVKVTHINTTSFASYADWLTDKKTKYVKILKQP